MPQNSQRLEPAIIAQLVCPACHGDLRMDAAQLVCAGCSRIYPVLDGIPVLIAEHSEAGTRS